MSQQQTPKSHETYTRLWIKVAAIVLFAAGHRIDAQEAERPTWTFGHRIEIRANYRDSHQDRFELRFPFPPDFLPPGQSTGFEETVDAGSELELSVVQLQLDLAYGRLLGARAKIHFQDKYRRNPTSTDRKIDADELFVRLGEKPEFLQRPAGTSFFIQAGKAPKMERQPVRLLESYGLASTSFNRFEDIEVLAGGTIGRSFYWRLQAANGNPVFFRDPNALAGDNGIPELLEPNPDPELKSGFPILYNAETEEYVFKTTHVQFGQGLGYRWQRADEAFGFDALLFHYRRSLADEEDLTGTFYGGDLDLLNGAFGVSLPITDRVKEEVGGRVYAEWGAMTAIAQFTSQHLAGLHRQGHELEVGYRFGPAFDPFRRGRPLLRSIEPAIRWSGLSNDFRDASPKTFVAPSVFWPWTKIDYGVRLGLAESTDLTIEFAKHNVGAPRKVDLDEALATIRVRLD